MGTFRTTAGAFITAALLGLAGTAHGSVLSITGSTTDTWQGETGQSIPTGTAGFVDGTLMASAGLYTFTFGGGGLVMGDTGHGDSLNPNEFWVGSSEAAAAAAGDVFCTQAGIASCGGLASAVGSSFTILLPAGAIPFGFTFGVSHSSVLTDGQVNNAVGAYLAEMGISTTASAGPGYVAYLGLSDSPYPADHDFQDLVVRVTAVPEPVSVSMIGLGLFGLAVRARRKLHRTRG